MQTDSVKHSCVHEDLLQDGNRGPLSFFSLGGVGGIFWGDHRGDYRGD